MQWRIQELSKGGHRPKCKYPSKNVMSGGSSERIFFRRSCCQYVPLKKIMFLVKGGARRPPPLDPPLGRRVVRSTSHKETSSQYTSSKHRWRHVHNSKKGGGNSYDQIYMLSSDYQMHHKCRYTRVPQYYFNLATISG